MDVFCVCFSVVCVCRTPPLRVAFASLLFAWRCLLFGSFELHFFFVHCVSGHEHSLPVVYFHSEVCVLVAAAGELVGGSFCNSFKSSNIQYSLHLNPFVSHRRVQRFFAFAGFYGPTAGVTGACTLPCTAGLLFVCVCLLM